MTASVLLAAAVLVLTWWGERKKTSRALVYRISLILVWTGLALLAAALVVGWTAVRAVAGMPVSEEWALTLCEGYAVLVLPVFFIVFLSLLLSSLLRRGESKQRKEGARAVRVWLSAVGSAACLLLSGVWILLTRGGHPDLSPAFTAAGPGFAFLLRLTLLFEYRP